MKWEFEKICVIGLGLIGGSFALNLKLNGFPGKVVAVDINPEAIEKGIDRGVIDTGSIKSTVAIVNGIHVTACNQRSGA